eukprot:UN22247
MSQFVLLSHKIFSIKSNIKTIQYNVMISQKSRLRRMLDLVLILL